jgi:hypothetical protein
MSPFTCRPVIPQPGEPVIRERLNEHAAEPVRVLLQFAGQDLGLLVGQRDRAGVNAAVLEDPLQWVAADLSPW